MKVEVMELGEADAKGRRKPVGTGKFETLELDAVISAIGQKIDLGGISAGTGIQLSSKGAVMVDELSYQTGEPDVFAGGDVVTGPKFAIDAIAAGKEASISIHRYVHPARHSTSGATTATISRSTRRRSPSRSAALTLRRARRPPAAASKKRRTFRICAATSPRSRLRRKSALPRLRLRSHRRGSVRRLRHITPQVQVRRDPP